ncbi:right-handed parallel beta-helix repeat-containing protein [Spirillospora sp. NPDC047279]|uniref:right-handed parallel beta-helix repeat-containing protein n=1 Tax=Spirillospora sp. NPDC047279 TaxID=3155478 RepID=UPI0033C9DCA7
MSRSARKAVIVKVLALPVIVLVAVAGWRLPQSGGDGEGRPRPGATATGAAAVGSTAYKVPEKALIVAPSGDDTAAGGAEAPLRTLGRAVAKAAPGATIVLRGGAYHESVTVPAGKRLTIQAHPGEAVWFDGTEKVTGWSPDGDGWVRTGWTHRFDSSPSYTSGAAASDDPDFRFVDESKAPMAAHPDQVWIDGAAQRQVESRAKVEDGTFYVDERGQRLHLGTDPRGKNVRASTLAEAITVRAAGTVLRGVGVRGYATSLPRLGTVKVVAPDVTVENVTVNESATTGLSVLGPRAVIRRVTALRNGILGIHANHADDLRIERVRVERNNTERFRYSPVSGGIKITRSRKVVVTGSVAADNLGKGVWMDESVHDITVTANRVVRNADHGIDLELCAKAVVAGNLVRDNRGDGMKINNTSDVQIWNNTLTGNGRTIHLVQDPRRASDPSAAGHDPRQKGRPDPEMTWLISKIRVSNNTVAAARPGTACLLCVEDHSHERSAAQMGIVLDGNAYVRRNDQTPSRLIVWSRGKGEPAVFGTLAEFRAATGQETAGVSDDTGRGAGAGGRIAAPLDVRAARAARPLPAPIARLLDKPGGTRHMGAWDL